MKTKLVPFWGTCLLLTLPVMSQMVSDSSLYNMKISPEAIALMPYRNYHVAIYESLNSERLDANNRLLKKYFCTSIPHLQPETAEYDFIDLNEQHIVSFGVVMWDDHLKQAALDFLNKKMKIEVGEHQITPIPFEQLLLVCQTDAGKCRCPKEWRPNLMYNTVHLSMVCPSKSNALSLVNTFQNNPKQLRDFFKIMFSLTSKQTRVSEAVISEENIRYGGLMSKLEQKFPGKSEVLLTADHANRLISESASNVLMDIYIKANEFVNEQSEQYVFNVLRDMMVAGTQKVDEDFKLWDSVYWKAECYRPDEVAHELNKLTEKLDIEGQRKFIDIVSKANNNISEISEILGSAEEKLSHVEWNGKKFIPKPMTLTRVNLANVRSEQNMQSRKVSVSISTAILAVPVIVNLHANDTSEASDGLQSKIRDAMNGISDISLQVYKTSFDVREALSKSDNLISFINDSKANTSAINEELQTSKSELERLRNDILDKETFLKDIIYQEKESIIKELSITKSMFAQDVLKTHRDFRHFSASVEKATKQEMAQVILESDGRHGRQVQMKFEELKQLITEERDHASSEKNLLQSELEQLKKDLLVKEKSLKDIIILEKESCLRAVNASISAAGKLETKTESAKAKKSYSIGVNPNTKTAVEADWFAARLFCFLMNMTLASIESKEDNEKIKKLIFPIEPVGKEMGFWIDGTRIGFWTNRREDYYWASTMTPIKGFQMWMDIQPDNYRDSEQCLEVWRTTAVKAGFGWNDYDCYKPRPFVCQTYV